MDLLAKKRNGVSLILVAFLFLHYLTDLACQTLQIIPREKNVKKFINDSYVVFCKVSDGSTNADWLNPKGEKIGMSLSRVRVENGFGADLFFHRITTEDQGLYTCVESSSGDKTSFNLNVFRPIAFDTSLAEQFAPEGSKTFLLRCKADAYTSPQIFWKVDGKHPELPKYKVTEGGLLIHNVNTEDTKKQYICRALDMESPMPDTRTMKIVLKVIPNGEVITSNGEVDESSTSRSRFRAYTQQPTNKTMSTIIITTVSTLLKMSIRTILQYLL